jgi:hypothetical protein
MPPVGLENKKSGAEPLVNNIYVKILSMYSSKSFTQTSISLAIDIFLLWNSEEQSMLKVKSNLILHNTDYFITLLTEIKI